MKALKFAILFCFVCSTVYADTHVKSKVLLAGETHSWLSGQKKRIEAKVPVVGKIAVITRVDRGVEWILVPDQKLYQEKPIALPYFHEEKSETSGGSDVQDYLPKQDEEEIKKQCVPEIRRIKGTRKIAGVETTGFTAICGNEKVPGKIWMAPPVGELAEIQKQDFIYNRGYAVELFKKFPPEDQQALIPFTEKFGDLAKNFFTKRMAKGTKFPEGVLMAVESTKPPQTLFEITDISTESVDQSLFEIPPGYKKVSNLAKAVLESKTKELAAFKNSLNAVKGFFEDLKIKAAHLSKESTG